MTSNQHGPYVQGYTRATMAGTMGVLSRKMELIPKSRSQFGSKAAIRLREAGIASNAPISNAAVNTFSGLVLTARQAKRVGGTRTSP